MFIGAGWILKHSSAYLAKETTYEFSVASTRIKYIFVCNLVNRILLALSDMIMESWKT